MEPPSSGSSEPLGPSASMVAGRVLLITLAVGLALGAFVFGWSQRDRHNVQLLHEKEATQLLDLQVEIVKREFDAIRSDTRFLSEQALLKGFIARGGSGKVELRQEYLLFSREKRMYDQIRYLDESGRESVRIDFHDGRPRAVPEDQLQDKSGRYYFDRARGLERGQVYVSPFDLNVEHGRIEEPLKPVVRFSAAAFDERGQRHGVVVLNYLARKLIDELIDLSVGTPGSVMLLDSKGYWLHGPEDEDEWGFMFGNERTYRLRHPAAWERMTSSQRGQFTDQDGLISFATVAYSNEGAAADCCALRLVHTLPSSDLYARSDQLLVRLLWGYGAIVTLTAISAWFLISAAAVRRRQERQIRASEGRLRLLSSQLLNVQEEERARLSRDIHDDLGSTRHDCAVLQLRMANRLQGDERTKQDRDRPSRRSSSVLDKSRELATGLRPPMLYELGLEGDGKRPT